MGLKAGALGGLKIGAALPAAGEGFQKQAPAADPKLEPRKWQNASRGLGEIGPHILPTIIGLSSRFGGICVFEGPSSGTYPGPNSHPWNHLGATTKTTETKPYQGGSLATKWDSLEIPSYKTRIPLESLRILGCRKGFPRDPQLQKGIP